MASELTYRYELGEPLGIGGTATVFRATHRESGRRVAVKILDIRLPGRRSEVAALDGLNHPGLVEIDEVGVHDGRTYLVMRLVEGEALSQRIDRGPLAPADVVALGARLSDTLSHVHGRGVVHRDVKPSNVLLDASRSPHLTDFGVSKLVDATRITVTGSVVGTPAYMAPEQVRGQEVGSAADVYALGLLLIEALTGVREYPGSVVESAVARLHRDPVVPGDLPVGLRALLTAMTAQDPADRPSAATVARELDALESAGRPSASPECTGPVSTQRPTVRAAAAASALAIATVIGVVGLHTAARAPIAADPRAVPAAPQAVSAAPEPTPVAAAVGTPVTSTATPGSPRVVEVAEVVADRPPAVAGSAGGPEESAGSVKRSDDPEGADDEKEKKVEKADTDVEKDKKGNGKKK